jgi:thiol-disulfide isomerase/thioredoxin
VLVAAGCGSNPETALPSDSEFFAPDGSASTLAQFEGQPIVLNFFASWCPPCVAELPEFEEVSREVADEVQFVGVSTDFQQDAWLRLVEDTGVTYPTFFQPSSALYLATESPSMPTTVFLDDEGKVAFTHAGRLSKATLLELIGTHLR